MHIRRTEDIAAVVRGKRRERGLSQQALADRLGVSRKWVSEFELGNSSAEIGLVLRALNELDIALTIDTSRAGVPRGESPVALDIDAIADTGLTTPPSVRRPRS